MWKQDDVMKLLLIMVAFYHDPRHSRVNPIDWTAVASLMGGKFTAGGVSQKFLKSLTKKPEYTEAKNVFGTGKPRIRKQDNAPTTPSTKRKWLDDSDFTTKVEEEEGEGSQRKMTFKRTKGF
jgi:hypothetical protein